MFGSKTAKKPLPRGKQAPADKPFVSVGSLFSPNIGASLRPMGQSGRMLVALIASIFAAHGLFPRNHPALLGIGNARLTLVEVMTVGWRNVVFTREKLPQTMIFFAVILSLGFSVIAIFAVAMALLTGTAHAQVPVGAGMFEADPTNDIALGWMNWLFLGQPMADYLTPLGQNMPAGTIAGGAGGASAAGGASLIQGALGTAFAFYSDAILVVAAIILFYHLASMIVETAHHGVAMGRRANQVWAPIRLVVAIGLLVPVSTTTGLNSGQYILLQVAAWGSGLASNAWSIFLTQLAANDFTFVPPVAPYARDAVVNSYLSAACAQAYNMIAGPKNGYTNSQVALPFGTPITNPDNSFKWTYTPAGTGVTEAIDNDFCGFYVQPAMPPGNANPSENIATAAYGVVWPAFQMMQAEAITAGMVDVKMFVSSADGGTWSGSLPTDTPNSQMAPSGISIEQLAYDYTSILQTQLSGLTTSAAVAMTAVADKSRGQGWVSAGTWFNTVMNLQGALTDIPRDLVVKTAPPQSRQTVLENHSTPGTVQYETAQVMSRFQKWLFMGFNSGVSGFGPSLNTTLTPGGLTAQQNQLLLAQAGQQQNAAVNKGHFMDEIFRVIDWVASWDNVWQADTTNCATATCFSLGVQFTSYNPIAEIASFGHSNINTAYDLFDDYIYLQGGASVGNFLGTLASNQSGMPVISHFLAAFGAAGHMTGEAAASIGSVVGSVVVVFFTGGFLCAYFLPLIPFYRFLFGTLSYFFSLFEGVLAIPLVALAHLTPEGEGFMGDKAKGAYYYVFDIFLRPILMVFGLIGGFLMFDLAASAMNLLYVTAVAGAGGLSYGHMALARLVYSILYVVILYLCCNNCFKLIDWLPEHAIKWMGGQSLQHAQMGDPMEVGSYMALAGGYVDNQIVQGAGKAMASPAGVAALGALRETKLGQQVGNQVRDSMASHLGGIQGGPSAAQIKQGFNEGYAKLDQGYAAGKSIAGGSAAYFKKWYETGSMPDPREFMGHQRERGGS